MNIAEKYDIDPDKLQASMELIKIQYQRDVAEYERTGNFQEQYDDIKNAAKILIAALKHAHNSVLYQVQAGDPLVDRLVLLKERATVGPTETVGRKSEFHRNLLVVQLTTTWRDLTGKKPNQSTKYPSFREFMEDVTEYLRIDDKGLWRKYKKFHSRLSR